MQFRHFDGSLTPVPSIGAAVAIFDRKDDWRNPDNISTGREVLRTSFVTDEDTGKVSLIETTATVGIERNDEYVSDTSVDYDAPLTPAEVAMANANSDDASAWNETEYGQYNTLITRRYHAKLLNVFRKDGVLRVGSVEIRTVADEDAFDVFATCVKCKAKLQIGDRNFYGLGYDLDLMQEFTARVIAHGHNHSAAWVSKTPVG